MKKLLLIQVVIALSGVCSVIGGDRQELRAALLNNRQDQLQTLINDEDDLYDAVLFLVNNNRYQQLARLLADYRVTLDGSDIVAGGQPLFAAVSRGHSLVTQLLLQHGADANAVDSDGRTPLALAVNQGNGSIVADLLLHNAQVNKADNNGVTPLMRAASLGNELIIRQLVRAGADPDAVDKYGRTALRMACARNHTGAIKALGGQPLVIDDTAFDE